MSSEIEDLNDKEMFFVIGAPKSGTTWLQKLLDAHPDVVCHGEDDFSTLGDHIVAMMNAYNQDSILRNAQQGNQRFCNFVQSDLFTLFETAFKLMMAHGTKTAQARSVGSKFLNFHRVVDLVDRVVPKARYLHILRDPRDVLVSAYYFNLVRNPIEMERMGSLVNFITQALPPYEYRLRRFLEFAEGPGRGRVATVRYCDLHAAPEGTMAELFRFLGVAADQAIVEAVVAEADFQRLAGGRERGQEEPTAFYRKGVVGDWREKFDEESRQAIADSALKDMLAPFGYDLACPVAARAVESDKSPPISGALRACR